MTAATKAVPAYISGHCGVGHCEVCRGEYAGVACNCKCEHKPEAAGVNGTDAVVAPAEDPKDAPKDGPVPFPSGVPASVASPTSELGDCWPWGGTLDSDGYARVRRPGGGWTRVARMVYEIVFGDLDEGLVVDHLCHDPERCPGGVTCLHRRCVNPEHLEAVTNRENTLRGAGVTAVNAAKTHCHAGHPFDEENTLIRASGWRGCRACQRDRKRARKQAPAAPPNLELVTAVVADLSAAVAEWVDGAQEIEALDALGQIRQARQDLAQIEATLERHAARVMTGDIIEWPGGVAERRFGKDRRAWDHDELVRQVVNLIAVDVATDKQSGETDDMLAALVQDACARFAETHRPDWRVTALKHMGLDADEFCESVPGRVTVAITQAASHV